MHPENQVKYGYVDTQAPPPNEIRKSLASVKLAMGKLGATPEHMNIFHMLNSTVEWLMLDPNTRHPFQSLFMNDNYIH